MSVMMPVNMAADYHLAQLCASTAEPVAPFLRAQSDRHAPRPRLCSEHGCCWHAQGESAACQAVLAQAQSDWDDLGRAARHRCGDVDRLVAAEQDGSASLWR